MIIAFETFCTLKGLKINVTKTKAMQINMNVNFKCYSQPIENVEEFKYLGLIINRAKNNPAAMLNMRIKKTEAAFRSIKCHARLLGLFNRRVRVQLV